MTNDTPTPPASRRAPLTTSDKAQARGLAKRLVAFGRAGSIEAGDIINSLLDQVEALEEQRYRFAKCVVQLSSACGQLSNTYYNQKTEKHQTTPDEHMLKFVEDAWQQLSDALLGLDVEGNPLRMATTHEARNVINHQKPGA